MGTKKGIDISYYQWDVDYTKVAKQIDFVILREGYRKTIDTAFIRHVNGFKSAGVPIIGVYHFIYALNESDALLEAKSCIANVEKAGLPKTTRIWADLEYDTIKKAAAAGVTYTKEMVNKYTMIFCDYVSSQGYPTGIYTNKDYYLHYYTQDTLQKYPLWLADTKKTPTYKCLVHQYGQGKMDGLIGSNIDLDYYYGAEDEVPQKEETSMPNVIEKAISFMEDVARDNSHGYDQIYRWNERGDYDCSSLVITAWEQAGVPVKTNGATYTGNMYSVFKKCGFKDVTSQVNLATGAGLQRGDVLLNHVHHVAMYCGNGLEVEASINERGGATYGTPGD